MRYRTDRGASAKARRGIYTVAVNIDTRHILDFKGGQGYDRFLVRIDDREFGCSLEELVQALSPHEIL